MGRHQGAQPCSFGAATQAARQLEFWRGLYGCHSVLSGRIFDDDRARFESEFTGRVVAAEEVLPSPILEPCRKLFDAVSHEGLGRALSALEDQIELRWASMRPAESRPTRRLKDWSRSLASRAAFSGPGRSSRRIARRIRSWTGLSERDLRGLGHAEQLYRELHEAAGNGGINWAEVAAAAGFADQAHMIRQMRRSSGFTPEQLRQKARSDEAFWGYRLLGEYFTKQ